MRKAKKWAKAFSLFLALSLVAVIALKVQGSRGLKGEWMDIIAGGPYSGCGVEFCVDSAIMEPPCRAFIPYTKKSFSNNYGKCFCMGDEPLVFDTVVIDLKGVSMSYSRDELSGPIVAIQIWLKDMENTYYKTDKFPLVSPVLPDFNNGFTIVVEDCLEVFPHKGFGKGRKGDPIGYLDVRIINYIPVN